MDDVVSGASDAEAAYLFYLKSRLRLATAGFNLRKFVTNSKELHQHIQENELIIEDSQPKHSPEETMNSEPTNQSCDERDIRTEDQSYAKTSLGVGIEEGAGIHKVLGVQWDTKTDTLQFDIGEAARRMQDLTPTKRSLVCVTAKFFDPLGIVSPVTILFKMFCQQLCESKVRWDEPLTGSLLDKWSQLLSMLQDTRIMIVPRCVYCHPANPIKSTLVGFCDASVKAYAAVVYLRMQYETHTTVHFLASKTRVTPIGGVTIPRLELLSALLLARLLTTIQIALGELTLTKPVCYSDSMVAIHWVRGVRQEWKQFVENRVSIIRSLVPPQHWRHCAGLDNPADIPSRGMSISTLNNTPRWLEGPGWLCSGDWQTEGDSEFDTSQVTAPDDCLQEMKHTAVTQLMITSTTRIGQLMSCEDFSSFSRLVRVTALILRFIRLLRRQATLPDTGDPNDNTHDINRARLLWLLDSQAQLESQPKFTLWKHQFDVFVDDSGLLRCRGRMSNSALAPLARTPILLNKGHHITRLLVQDAHKRVLHNGVAETLAELRAEYWLVRGRQFVRGILYKCVTCRKLEGKHCRGNPPPPLPDYRVQQSRPFQTTGVDFAGPLYVRSSGVARSSKVWLCLFTCSSTRAVHLDLVEDMTATTFLRGFKRFTARRGMPSRVLSDNGKTFTCASTIISNVLSDPEVSEYFNQLNIVWKFNMEKAPWWGGLFERMIKSAKRCLRKVIGRNCLTYDELLTLVVEVEAVLNSRPLSYVSSEDLTEPLTPSHLMLGFRVMSLPDHSIPDDPDFCSSTDTLTRRMNHLAKVLQHFWNRWKREYLLELREHHRVRLEKGLVHKIQKGEIVTVYDECHPRGMWRLGRIEELIEGTDGKVRGVRVRTQTSNGCISVLQRPVQHIYPLEVRSTESLSTTSPNCCAADSLPTNPVDSSNCCPTEPSRANRRTQQANETEPEDERSNGVTNSRPKRAAAKNAHGIIQALAEDTT